MKFKLISCEVFMRLACLSIADSPHTIDPEYTPLKGHEAPDALRQQLQQIIDDAEGKDYDAVLLCMGLCGNAAAGVIARSIPIIVPRAHDCCTIFIGSREKFLDNFKDNLSSEWGAQGYMERSIEYIKETDTGKMLGWDKDYQDLVEQYGEENAEFLWETLHPKVHSDEMIYIEIPETAALGYADKMRKTAEESGKTLRILEGDSRLIKSLLHGNWNNEEYLIVKPGQMIKAVYDHEKVLDVEN